MAGSRRGVFARLRSGVAAQAFRIRLADPESLLHFSLLGLLAGVLAGLSITAFRLLVESALGATLPGGDAENFEDLAPPTRVLLVCAGALVLALLAQCIPAAWRAVGVAHVIERFNRHSGHMPAGNLLWQFCGGAIALISGQCSGREGPSIHIGAAVNSLAGRSLHLPDNSIQILVGCGTAASIAAAFDTPLAGVIFAMEVVMMEYTISGFVPVILAAASGATVARAVFGETLHFSVAPPALSSLAELPGVAALGLAVGTAAALFIALQSAVLNARHYLPFTRIALAGILTAGGALAVPSVMGVGYDSLNAALLGEIGLQMLFALAAAKLLLTAIVSGLGMPIGIIGPALLIGGCLGGGVCAALDLALPRFEASNSLYVLLGMTAMMGATLNAPMAALTAVMELSGGTGAMLPGMLAVISANLVCRVVYKQSSSYQRALEAAGVTISRDPVRRTLERVGVVSAMDRDVFVIGEFPKADALERLEQAQAARVVFRRDKSHWVAERAALIALLAAADPETWPELDLESCAARCRDVPAQASLREAWQRLQEHEAGAVCVVEPLALSSVLGIIDRETLARELGFQAFH